MCCDQGMDFDTYERGLWAGRAAAYERGFARLTAHTAGALLDAAGVAAGTRVLDVGTGPGVVAGAAAALAELRRVLRGGGRLALTCWTYPPTGVTGIGSEVIAARIKDEFDRVVARYAVDAGRVARPAVAVLGSGAAKKQRPGRAE
jgi:hypothetical protein